MARMERPTSRHSFGCRDDHWDALDDIIASEDYDSKSALLRELVADKVAEYNDDGRDQETALPDDPRLRDAYLTLLDIADERVDGGGLRCTVAQANNNLYTQTTPKDAVKSSLLTPLRAQDYIRIDPGMSNVWIVVRPLHRVLGL